MKNRRLGMLAILVTLIVGATPLAGCGTSDSGNGNTVGQPTCAAGTAECVNGSLLRVCPADGTGWLAVSCLQGETCSGSACSAAPPTCTTGDKGCATDTITQTCATDGSTWIYVACGFGETCIDGDCFLDVDGATCRPGETLCGNDATLLTCNSNGVGFAATTCPGKTFCVENPYGATCEGTGCGIGTGGCNYDMRGGYTCVDGSTYAYFNCPTDEYCVPGPTTAECSPTICAPGAQQCGDPLDSGYATTAGYSYCGPLNDGSVGWTLVECASPTTCIFDPYYQEAYCDAECLPGEQQCYSETTTQTCTANGTWGPTTPCNAPTEAPLLCWMPTAATAACVDPACYDAMYWGLGGEVGACEGSQIRICDGDGRLAAAPAQNCSIGRCMPYEDILGQMFGWCQADCVAGEKRCSGEGYEIQSCGAQGLWEVVPAACPTDQLCFDYSNGTSARLAICGVCTPGERRCTGVPTFETCGADARWGTATTCAAGICTEGYDPYLGFTTTYCINECVPGQVVCVGVNKPASDGAHSGTASYATCTAQGRVPTMAVACAGSTVCREDAFGDALGCVECVGTSSPSGNEDGLADQRCATVGEAVQTCTAANDWSVAAVTCGVGTACYQGLDGNAVCEGI